MEKMRILRNYLALDLKRNLVGKKTILSAFGIAVTCLTFSVQYFTNFPAIYVYGCCFFASSFLLPAIFLLASIPGSISFCQDAGNNFLIYAINRGEHETYGWSKILANMITTFAVSLCGLTIYCCVIELCLHNQPFNNMVITGIVFDWEQYHHQPWLYYLIHNIIVASASALWASVAMLVSSFVPDYVVVLSVPIVANYVVERIGARYVPDFLNLSILTLGMPVGFIVFPYYIVYSVLLFMGISLLCGFLFVDQVERRMGKSAC